MLDGRRLTMAMIAAAATAGIFELAGFSVADRCRADWDLTQSEFVGFVVFLLAGGAVLVGAVFAMVVLVHPATGGDTACRRPVFTWPRLGQLTGIALGMVLIVTTVVLKRLGKFEFWLLFPAVAIVPGLILLISSTGHRRLALKGLALLLFSATLLYTILAWQVLGSRLGLPPLALMNRTRSDSFGEFLRQIVFFAVVVTWHVGVIMALFAGTRSILGTFRGPPGFCRNCGYSLRGNVSGLCPECGCPI